MIEVPVGDFVIRDNKVYKCVEGFKGSDESYCMNCDFNQRDIEGTNPLCYSYKCTTDDCKELMFILYDTIPDDTDCNEFDEFDLTGKFND